MPSVVPFVLGQKLSPDDTDLSLIQRTNLLQRLDELSTRKMCLLLAPPGSGKTILLSQFYHRHAGSRTQVWLRLDDSDLDPVRFFRHLSEAVRRAWPEFDGFNSLQYYGGDVKVQAELALSTFVSGLQHAPTSLHIFIDNIEQLERAVWNSLLQQLVELAPKHVHWILSGTQAHGIDSARLQSRGELGTMLQPELFFTQAEMHQFLDSGADTESAVRDAVCQRTKGWPAAMRLAKICLSQPAQTTTGDMKPGHHTTFADWCDCALNRLPPTQKQFLIDTALLEHFSPALCDYMLHATQSAHHIREFENLALFLEKDRSSGLYRYHDLLREYLQDRFQQLPAEKRNRLIARACTWLVEHDEREQACRLARHHSEGGFFAEMLRESFNEWFREGLAEPVFYWARELGDAILLAMPETRYAWCWALTMFGQLVEAEAVIERAFIAPLGKHARWQDLFVETGDTQDTTTAVIFSIIRLFRGELEDVHINQLQRLYKAISITQDLRASIDNILAKHAIQHCRFVEARERAAQATLVLRQAGNRIGQAMGMYLTADSYYQNNDIKGALLTCNQYLEDTPANRNSAPHVLIEGYRAFLLYQSNKPLEAENIARELLCQRQPGYNIDMQMYLYLPLIRMKTRRGDFLQARNLLNQLQQASGASGSPIITAHTAYERLRLAVAKGNSRELTKWAECFNVESRLIQALDPGYPMLWEIRERWILAGILLHMQHLQFDRARSLAQQLLYLNVDHGYPIRYLPLNMCVAFLDHKTDQISSAFKRLNDTLTQAEATGMTMGLIDDLPGMDDFICTAIVQNRILNPGHVEKFRTLGIFDFVSNSANPQNLDPVEEAIALRLQAGSSSAEIARELTLAGSTVEWHRHNIFYKLDVDDASELTELALQ